MGCPRFFELYFSRDIAFFAAKPLEQIAIL